MGQSHGQIELIDTTHKAPLSSQTSVQNVRIPGPEKTMAGETTINGKTSPLNEESSRPPTGRRTATPRSKTTSECEAVLPGAVQESRPESRQSKASAHTPSKTPVTEGKKEESAADLVDEELRMLESEAEKQDTRKPDAEKQDEGKQNTGKPVEITSTIAVITVDQKTINHDGSEKIEEADMPERVSPTSGMGGRRGSNTSLMSGKSTGSSLNGRAADVEIAFVDPLDNKYECPVCTRVLRYPVQFEDCGHRCCSSCLPELLRVAPRCPKDQKEVSREKVFVDKKFTKEIDMLAVKCANHVNGCKWKGNLKDFYSHYEDCKYLKIPCTRKCGAEFEKRFLDKHLREDCPKRDMTCEFCKNKIPADEEITHLNVCKRFPIPCPNGCKKKDVPREELDDHMENDCSKQGIPCPFSECGCDHRCARKEMNKHIRDEPVKHLTLVGQTILAHKKTLEMHSEIMDSQNDKLDKASRRVDGLEKLYGSQLIWKIDNYEAKLEEAKAGKKPTIFSPPFLTSRHGYKLAMSCCLYGDGKARGKNLSVFVCICKGEFDALLLWPFSHRVTFTLIDQCQDPEARRNVTYSVKPNTCKENKAFLGRPSGDRNASFGAQKFCELSILDTLDYIRDDTLFIKVNIEMDDMVML